MIKIGYYSAISGFVEMKTEDNDFAIYDIMDELYRSVPPNTMRGKICVRAYKDDEVLYQFGSC